MAVLMGCASIVLVARSPTWFRRQGLERGNGTVPTSSPRSRPRSLCAGKPVTPQILLQLLSSRCATPSCATVVFSSLATVRTSSPIKPSIFQSSRLRSHARDLRDLRRARVHRPRTVVHHVLGVHRRSRCPSKEVANSWSGAGIRTLRRFSYALILQEQVAEVAQQQHRA